MKYTNKMAEILAREAHTGQLYGKFPYITHVERVASAFEGYTTMEAIAWLHDIVEDTHISLNDLADMGFNSVITSAVDALSRREETYSVYLTRVMANNFAKRVKLIDLADNLSNCFNNKGKVIDEHKHKQKRYVKAIKKLLNTEEV